MTKRRGLMNISSTIDISDADTYVLLDHPKTTGVIQHGNGRITIEIEEAQGVVYDEVRYYISYHLAQIGRRRVIAEGGARAKIPKHDNDISKTSEKIGIYILELIATPATREAVVGDLLEARDAIREKHGERKAQIYFWWQVTRAIFPFLWSMIKRWSWVAALLAAFGWVRRQFSS